MIMKTIIGHLDMDAFFAAVEERDKPWLKGSPVVVGADPLGGRGRGIVATANYKAREYGIRSALPISRAWKFSEQARDAGKPGAVFLTPSLGRYSKVSKELIGIVQTFVPRIQVTSVDEMYFDLSHTGSYKKAKHLAKEIKTSIKKKTKLTASIGIGPNKMIAKIASDFEKPNGLTVVTDRNVEKFIEPLCVRSIPGIGPKMEEKLATLGARTVGDLRKHPKEELAERFGKWGSVLYEKARGISSTDLSERGAAKSVGEHETFSMDTKDMKYVLVHLEALAEDILRRLRKQNFHGFRTVVLTVRFADFETKQRSVTTKTILKTVRDLQLKAIKLLLPFFAKTENPRRKPIRMIGLRIEKLE